MNTGLGLSFLRFVNEEGSNGWAQVYARIPFDDVELKTKGALLGSVFGKEIKDWADVEAGLTNWVDEYFNGSTTKGDLLGFFDSFRSKYPDLTGVWIWITLGENNKRELRLVKWGEAGAFLLRKEKEFDLTGNLEEGKVIRGNLEEGDGLTLWTPVPPDNRERISEEDFVTDLSGLLKEENRAAAGLVFKIDKLESVLVEEEGGGVVVPVSVSEAKVETKQQVEVISNEDLLEESSDQELVSNQFVGPIGMKEKLWNWWNSLRQKEQSGLMIKREVPKRKKWAGFLGVVFLLLLVMSIVTGSIKMKNEAEAKRWRSFAEPIEKSMQEALDLSKINPSGAKKIMEEVKVGFEAKKADFVDSKYKKELADLEKKINDGWVITSGEKESQTEELVNIDLVRPGFKGNRLTLVKGSQLVLLDNVMGVVVTAETKTKDVKVVAGKGEGLGWIDVSYDGKDVLVMDKAGVTTVGKNQGIVFDSAVLDPITMGRFSGNVYVLDKGNKEIFKYGVLSDGYGDRSRWLKQGQSISVIPVDMAIDSDIWVVGEVGQVEKYRRGAREQFAVSGLPTEVKVSRLAVELTGDKLALLDASNGMVAICSKENGNCTQQLKSDKLREATDIEFDESGNLLVLLPGKVGILK